MVQQLVQTLRLKLVPSAGLDFGTLLVFGILLDFALLDFTLF